MAKRKGGPEEPTEKNRPAHEVKVGKIRCAVWANHSPEQGTWYSMTFSRAYTDGAGVERSAQSYGRDDLLVLAEVSRQAFLWIARQQGGVGISDSGTAQEQPAQG